MSHDRPKHNSCDTAIVYVFMLSKMEAAFGQVTANHKQSYTQYIVLQTR